MIFFTKNPNLNFFFFFFGGGGLGGEGEDGGGRGEIVMSLASSINDHFII